jgi:hypothetical protein
MRSIVDSSQNGRMSQAFFAIAGAIVGVLGTVLTALVGARHEEQRIWRETLRTVCANLTGQVSELQDLSHQLRHHPDNPDLQQAAEQVHTKARGFYEQLRLTSKSAATQEAARWVIHCIYYQWRATQGGPGDFWEWRKLMYEWLTKLYVQTRKELGLGVSDVYKDPEGGLPVPVSKQDDSAS